MSLYIFDEIFLQRIYDIETSELKTIIDVGANTGMFTLRAKQLWPHARIVAFEPDVTNFSALAETISINNLEGVVPVQSAIASTIGTTKLYRHPHNLGGHSIVHRYADEGVDVPTQTLEEALALFPDGKCDLLKLDCEGAEGEIIKNLTPDTASRLKAIIYEPDATTSNPNHLRASLESLGFDTVFRRGVVIARRHD